MITRPEPGASQTAARLSAMGFDPILASVLSITHLKVCPPNRWAATVLTSQNAVPSCPPSMHGRPVFAVGTATATAAAKAGFSRVFNADGDATALARLIETTASPADGTLVLPTAQGQGGELARSLRQRGCRVLRRVAYRVAPVAMLPASATSSLRDRQVTAVMFFSGETVRHFVGLLQAAGLTDAIRDVEAVSISEPAAVALRHLPWRRIHVAATPNQDAMLALLQ
jgi:uroporphyrinogen-III synthase